MQPGLQAIDWPVTARPVVRNAGLFPLSASGFEFVYRSQTHAIHLHEYPGTLRLCGRDHALTRGTMTFTPAGEPSSYDLPAPGGHWCIHFEPVRTRTGLRVTLPLVRSLGDRHAEVTQRFAHVTRLHSRMSRATETEGQTLGLAASVALQELLLWAGLIEHLDPTPAPTQARAAIDGVIDIVRRELHKPLSVPALCRRVGMSQNYLARQFRAQTGMTLPTYILRQRIDMARLLLATTNLPVKQIGARVGLPDAQHFNKQFRRLTGHSPSAARSNKR